MSMYIGKKCVICEATITEKNDAHFLMDILDSETVEKLEHYKKPLCCDCKKEMLFGGIIEVL